jgi:hypothetical protein
VSLTPRLTAALLSLALVLPAQAIPPSQAEIDAKNKKVQEEFEKLPSPTQSSLNDMLSLVDTVEVLDGGINGDAPMSNKVLLRTSDAKKVNDFRESLRIVEDPKTFDHCNCFGRPTLVLSRGNERIAVIGMQHGLAIRWSKWKWDARLLSPEVLLGWLASEGVRKPQEEFQKELKGAADREEAASRWLAAIPESIKKTMPPVTGKSLAYSGSVYKPEKFFTDKSDSVELSTEEKKQREGKMKQYFLDDDTAIASLLAWRGAVASPWNGCPTYEEIPDRMLDTYPPAEIARCLKEDCSDGIWEGAARYFAARPEGRKFLSKDQKKALLKKGEANTDSDTRRLARLVFR